MSTIAIKLPPFLDPLSAVFEELFDHIDDVVDWWSKWLRDYIGRRTGQIGTWLWDVGIPIRDTILERINDAIGDISQLDFPSLFEIGSKVDEVGTWLWDVGIALQEPLITAIATVKTGIENNPDLVKTLLDPSFTNIGLGVASSSTGIIDAVIEHFDNTIDLFGGNVSLILEGITGAFSEGFKLAITAIFESLDFLTVGIMDGIQRLRSMLSGVFEPLLMEGISTITGIMTPGSPPVEYQETISELVKTIMEQSETLGETTAGSLPPYDEVRNKALLFAGLMSVGIAGTTILGGVLDATHPIKQWQFREAFADIFEVLLPEVAVGSVLQLPFTLGTLTFFEYYLRERYRSALPAPDDLMTWYQRKFIGEEQLFYWMGFHGFADEHIDRYARMTQRLPGSGDLIRFVVREVITPERFTEIMGEQGYIAEHAEWYWRAHWELPAVGQVMEMFHRELSMPIIELTAGGVKQVTFATNAEERLLALEKYLVLADYAPEWRDMIRDISYTTIGRIDARYGWELGEIDDARLEKLLRAEGYNPDDATLVAEIQKYRVLVAERNEIIRRVKEQYVRGWITQEDLDGMLAGLIVRPEIVQYQSVSAEFDRDLEEREAWLTIYLQQFTKEQITEAELIGFLNDLNLQQWRITFEINIIKAKKGQKVGFRETQAT